MQIVNSSEIQSRFGEYLDIARSEPVQVRRAGKPVAVILSNEEFEHLQALEDAYWAARATAAEREGRWIGHEEAMKLLTEQLIRES